ncbi:MAG: DNA polymerase III subunit gamma/tau [Defluviitaleaceae bacterium]|nr:DNA polymerase III subunit gamma/tau [Defluviitaleaceae bacterium]MCL2274377.1 DNA polymerase III subunit gamma/tau [Defluviitaleaceae bacterium]
MPYTVLYRKKRPRAFSQIVGQPHVVEALRNQLRSGQTSHAYLFCGTRGTGKTTAAKIMARAINCTDLKDGDPCNVCAACESILADRCLDVAEIDAASNNGVDDIRNLRDEVKYPPTECTHKVYIIDEVHMLSGAAFNALLKTLEEPPPHVVFILATTDPQKVPVTVLSRCQRYDFRRIKTPDIVGALGKYLNEENCPFEEDALAYIAYHCDGAMRDALSLLDQALSLRPTPDAPLTLTTVRDLLGAVDRQVLFDFTNALATRDGFAALTIIDTAAKDGRDMGQLAADLVRHFRDGLVASLVSGAEGLDVSTDMAEKLKAQGEEITPQVLMEYIRVFSNLLRELRFAPHKRTAVEVCALSLCVERVEKAGRHDRARGVDSPVAGADDNAARSNPQIAPERTTHPALPSTPLSAPATASTPAHPQEKKLTYEPPMPMPTSTGNPADVLSSIQADWLALCKSLAYPLRSWLARCKVSPQGEQLLITCDNEAESGRIKTHQMTIREAIADRYNLSTPPLLAFAVGTAQAPPAKRPAPTAQSAPYPVEDIPPPPEDNSPPDDMPVGDDEWAAFGQASLEGESPF